MKPMQEHRIERAKLARRAALANARMLAKEWRIERHDGHANRETIDKYYELAVKWWRSDASEALAELRSLGQSYS